MKKRWGGSTDATPFRSRLPKTGGKRWGYNDGDCGPGPGPGQSREQCDLSLVRPRFDCRSAVQKDLSPIQCSYFELECKQTKARDLELQLSAYF